MLKLKVNWNMSQIINLRIILVLIIAMEFINGAILSVFSEQLKEPCSETIKALLQNKSVVYGNLLRKDSVGIFKETSIINDIKKTMLNESTSDSTENIIYRYTYKIEKVFNGVICDSILTFTESKYEAGIRNYKYSKYSVIFYAGLKCDSIDYIVGANIYSRATYVPIADAFEIARIILKVRENIFLRKQENDLANIYREWLKNNR